MKREVIPVLHLKIESASKIKYQFQWKSDNFLAEENI